GLAWMQFFLIYVALPCLFYRLIADKPLEQLANWPFIMATTLTTYCAFALSFAVGMWHVRWHMPQGVMQGVAVSYSNIGYMGPPLVLSALGPAASAPVVLIFVFDNLLLFSLVPFLMAIAGAEKRSLAVTGREVAWKVATHAFNIATVLGIGAAYAKLQLPEAIDKIVSWLSNAAAPCALFLLGVTVALRPILRMPREVPALVTIKLVVHPLLVWVLLSALGSFDPTWTYAAIVMAALPPALKHLRDERASACVLVGTLVSMATHTAFLWFIKTGRMTADLFPG
ncbi:MAG TPA: AEC family transporter, partial [Beijerinckiaceae bacterium]|nr:AEC family transporter [Beijerinckiaceae bacterium]